MSKFNELQKWKGEKREDIGAWLNGQGLIGDAVEIGCLWGGFARGFLKQWSGEKYFMVDLWAKQDDGIYRERTDNVDYEQCYRDCVALSEKDKRISLVRLPSVVAAITFPDESLDFVFIDANHSYRAVLDDMDAWYPKVKSGGLFSGHDYCPDDTNWPNWNEVKSAVDRWSAERWIPFEAKCDSWWMIKP